MFEPPFADEGFAPRLDLFARRRLDHVVVVGGDLLLQALGRMRQQVPVLVNSTALHRRAIPHGGDCGLKPRRTVDNEEFGTAQAAPDEIVENGTPGFGTLAAHTLDREQHFLTVRTYAEDNQQRYRGRLAVEPDPDHSAVEDQSHDRLFGQRAGIPGVPVALHLAPQPANRVLADRSSEQSVERAAYTASVGAGQVAAGDQCVGG